MHLPRPKLRRPAGLRLPRPRLPQTRAGQRRALQLVMLLSVLGLLPATWMFTSADGRLHTVENVPRTDVAVVFGAGLRNGEPSRYLARRLDTAVELYETGRIKVVLVSGDKREGYDEPGTMRSYLTERGVPAARIVSDNAGYDTWDSCVRAKKVFGVDRAVLISQTFHIRRAVVLCEEAGVQSYGVGVEDRHFGVWYYGAVREIFAAWKAALDAWNDPDPRVLGPEEPGVERALASAR
ncbi:SanA/YdcF family protein [Streptomyces blattellae]|uniref:SanA/YdcF family protein n=1 Tax=Streptomyces blattellae TaxID=2569855 RepID=UPI0012B72E26|nr:ElyC/SanA/YdcF family protein [Streptomyces blattellae]